jgi:molybdopterin-guanine dinucleotide biosynthesis protein A
MQAAGYVLVGGRSSRMGADKALLSYRETTLASHVATQVLAAAGNVTLVGDRDRYRHLGFPVISDRIAGNGPLGGIAAAVNASPGWALVVGCDMPNVTSAFLNTLIEAAAEAPPWAECVVPSGPNGIEPLCALYHRRSLLLLDSFLNQKFLKMMDVVGALQAIHVPVRDPGLFVNLNTPEEFQAHE